MNEKFTADNWQHCAFKLVKNEILEKLKDKTIRGNITNNLADEITYVFDKVFWTFGEIKTFEYPANWTDAFKLRFFPLWALTLFPATMTKIIIKEVVSKLPEKYDSRLYAGKGNTYIPEITLKDPEEYKFTFEKYEKRNNG